ncbi:MAG: hypothetical protein IKR59_07600 [Lachnospiraceae bacterium]|nr:hypothetical protein [Lachnospiraceae bacterium]
MTAEGISIIISATSVFVAAVSFLLNFFRTKKVETMNQIDKLFDGYYNLRKKTVKENYHEYVEYLSFIERFSRAVINNIYSWRIVKNNAGRFLLKFYRDHKTDIIDQRRQQFKNESYYFNFEKLAKKIEKSKVDIS